MNIFKSMEVDKFEEVALFQDKTSGLRLIIAIHDTTLGPALGGCRMWPYESEEDAIRDALRLAQGMTYKNAAAGLNYGGGKSVIWGDPAKDKSEQLFRALGRAVDSLGGRFITGTDVGTMPEDFVIAGEETRYVTSKPEEYGGSGNSAIPTALGVKLSIYETLKELFGTDSLKGIRIAVQGLGKVGSLLVPMLLEGGAEVIVTEAKGDRLAKVAEEHPDVKTVSLEEIYDVECDIFSPNALGAVLNDETIPRLKCKAVVGAANNQLAREDHGAALAERNILYAPDYIVNAGGVIQVADELEGLNKERVMHKVGRIPSRLRSVFELAKEQNIPTNEAAIQFVKRRIENIGRIKRIHVPRAV